MINNDKSKRFLGVGVFQITPLIFYIWGKFLNLRHENLYKGRFSSC